MFIIIIEIKTKEKKVVKKGVIISWENAECLSETKQKRENKRVCWQVRATKPVAVLLSASTCSNIST